MLLSRGEQPRLCQNTFLNISGCGLSLPFDLGHFILFYFKDSIYSFESERMSKRENE